MPAKKRRAPQEKKRLSLSRDRRNRYGENDKASRKSLPLKRARKQRVVRRAVRRALGVADPEAADARVRAVRPSEDARKTPDVPLGEVVRQKRAWRAGPSGK